MTEMGMKVESEIKLFGKTILVSDSSSSSSSSPSQDTKASSIEETLTQATTLSDTTNDRNCPSKEDSLSHNGSKNEQEASESSGASQDGTAPKKPDKILPCPRCNSVDTKFCYYNNYNVNQPRYFCKNCQRYWTSGGAMRNVPVGSGRRKHKTFSIPTNYHHVIISDALPVSMTSNGYLIFGSHATTSCELPDVSGKPQNSRLPVTLYQATPFWGSTLGKRTREEAAFGVQPAGSKKGIPLNKEGSIRVSSNSRIVDSKRTAMGCMENERFRFGYGMGLFGSTTTTILEANPAALSRSLNFHETV